MVWPQTFSAYAQFHEDITLAALLDNKDGGFYVDVGANQEEYHSVTKYFYDRGWNGINIEPIPRLHKQFIIKRKRDINLNLAVSSKNGVLSFREYPKHDGLSTFSAEAKKENEKLNLPFKDYDVKVERLDTIFKQAKVTAIDFLKIDVEGYEGEVLRSNDWKLYRPAVVCIEANHRDNDWNNYLEGQGYSRYIFDGLNEYYLAIEKNELKDGFAERAAILAHNSLRSHHKKLWDKDAKELNVLKKRMEEQDHELAELKHNLRSLKYLTKQQAKELAQRFRRTGHEKS